MGPHQQQHRRTSAADQAYSHAHTYTHTCMQSAIDPLLGRRQRIPIPSASASSSSSSSIHPSTRAASSTDTEDDRQHEREEDTQVHLSTSRINAHEASRRAQRRDTGARLRRVADVRSRGVVETDAIDRVGAPTDTLSRALCMRMESANTINRDSGRGAHPSSVRGSSKTKRYREIPAAMCRRRPPSW